MRIAPITANTLPGFIAYCKRHRPDLDESYLYDEDLDGFLPDAENPTAVALDDTGEVIGAGSLVVNAYMRRGNRARVRILHAEAGGLDCYKRLFEALLPHTQGLGHITAFSPEGNGQQRAAFEALGFAVERYSNYLVREGGAAPDPALPAGFSVRAADPAGDAEEWCSIRNAAFRTLKGSEAPMTEDMAQEHFNEALEGGAMLLCRGGVAVGLVKIGRDTWEGRNVAEIGPLAVLPQWQGRGLGRALLREALRFAHTSGYETAVLCVNAENERAAKLYFQEGFRTAECAVCYRYELA